MSTLFEKHHHRITQALRYCEERTYWSPFQESPSAKHHPSGAHEQAKKIFKELLGNPFPLKQPNTIGTVGKEISPYTQQPLGISYPKPDIEPLMDTAKNSQKEWTYRTEPKERVGVCLELIEQLSQNNFLNTYASMHTAGMSFMMGFAGSGANALDRGLEALAHAHKAMSNIPSHAKFTRSFARGPETTIDKSYHLVGRGVAVVVCCGTFPTWNAYPAIFANLATGNSVVLKPHPNGILPVAIVVQTCRRLLEELGYNPDIILLAADEPEDRITIPLLEHKYTAIIDFTGSPTFGSWIENNCNHALVYTETAGCNSVIIESTNNYDGMLHAIAHSLCLFSSQMCTSAQNIFIPQNGIQCNDEHISYDKIVDDLVAKIDKLTADPKIAAALCGCVMSPVTFTQLDTLREEAKKYNLVRDAHCFAHPQFPNASTATPMLVEVGIADSSLYQKEHFGPMAFIIRCPDADSAILQASQDAKNHGSIASYAYSVHEQYQDKIAEAFIDAGASIGFNLIAHLPINFSAAYSDFHVTGLNPAGNACLTDIAFVASRFRIVQIKRERI
ncbi:MAG: phenylacetic acid degradation protein PaaN [Deltaproteobacteria bacterium]|nr:phenylacetic acid degradation protein PaaN [Deltaproteobacteria bacterium]